MSPVDYERTVLEALAQVAPELDESALHRGQPFREQLDLDSIDFLRFVVALSQRAGADIPEADYPRLTTIESCARLLAERTGAAPLQK